MMLALLTSYKMMPNLISYKSNLRMFSIQMI